jgi:hypothetical protein
MPSVLIILDVKIRVIHGTRLHTSGRCLELNDRSVTCEAHDLGLLFLSVCILFAEYQLNPIHYHL